MRKLAVDLILCSTVLLLPGAGYAQFGRGAGDWGSAGSDAQRSGWVRNDAKISLDRMQKPGGFALTWKLKFQNEPKQLNGLSSASLLTSYIGIHGFRSFAFVGGSSDNVFVMDTDLGRTEWTKHFDGAAKTAGTLTCPGGMTAMVVRPVTAAFMTAPTGRGGGGGGRGSAAKSAVGEPLKGGVTVTEAEARAAAMAANPAAAGGRGGGGGGGGRGGMPQGRRIIAAHALSSDGRFHTMYVSNGEEPEAAIPFIPAGANVSGLMVVDNVAYAVTTDGCNGVADGVWALDIASKQVASWRVPNGGIAGSGGPAVGPDGTVYVTTGSGDLVSLEAKTLKMKDAYRAGQPFASSPMMFQFKDKTMVAAAAKDGSIHVVDSAAMSSAVAKSEAGSPVAGSLASWQDTAGTRWILAPLEAGKIVALKLMDSGGAATFAPGWTSGAIPSPTTPMIVNGVVFAAASGEFQTKDSKMTAAQRAQKSTNAVLYALDSGTGKELFNSGKTITSFSHNGGLSGGGSLVYLETYDGMVYSFGFPIEH